MADPLTTLRNEWPVIIDAPWSFLTITALVGAAVWGIACLYYKGRIATLEHRLLARDDEIKTLNAKLAEALATPKKAAPKAPPSDPDEIKQHGRVVGRLNGSQIRLGEGIVGAASLTANGDYNPEKIFFFRDFELMLADSQSVGRSVMAGETRQQFSMVVCKILG